VVEGRFTATVFIEFCTRLLHDAPGPVFLIVDGHSVHRAGAVGDFRRRHRGAAPAVLPARLVRLCHDLRRCRCLRCGKRVWQVGQVPIR
jgi:hypothetical protein